MQVWRFSLRMKDRASQMFCTHHATIFDKNRELEALIVEEYCPSTANA